MTKSAVILNERLRFLCSEFIKSDKSILKIQQRFESERINKITLNSNDDKRMQSIDLIEKYAYGTSKDLVCDKEVIECNNIKKRYKI